MAVDLVRFMAEGHRFALEASRVLAKRQDRGSVHLVIRLADGAEGSLRVSEPVELVTVPPGQIHPVPPLLARRCTLPGLSALAFDHEGIFFLLEPT